MTKIKRIYGLILAGGFSRRMGQDKALMVYHSQPQIDYVYELLSRKCSKVFLSKRPDQKPYKQFSSIDDDLEFSHIGPLGGILSAMKAYSDVAWLVMACDLPFVTHETLEFLIENHDPQKMATAFKSVYDNLPEPLCALWEGHGNPKILEYVKNNIYCPRKILINSDTKLLEQKNKRWLDNVNDMKEFQQAMDNLN